MRLCTNTRRNSSLGGDRSLWCPHSLGVALSFYPSRGQVGGFVIGEKMHLKIPLYSISHGLFSFIFLSQ